MMIQRMLPTAWRTAVPCALLLMTAACGPTVGPAELVLHGGKIVTVDETQPEAEALAVTGGRIVAVGSNDEIDAYIGDGTEVVDLAGQTAIPGFIEGHGHFLGVGGAQMQLRLAEARSWDEIVTMVAAAVEEAQPGELIRGRGWHQEKWDPPPDPNVGGFPIHELLSEVSPDNPVVLTHASGHATFANARAMEMSGVTRDTPDPEGGEVLRDADGDAIGVFSETAGRLLRGARAERRAAEPATASRAGGRGGAPEGDHQFPGRRILLREGRSLQGDGGRR